MLIILMIQRLTQKNRRQFQSGVVEEILFTLPASSVKKINFIILNMFKQNMKVLLDVSYPVVRSIEEGNDRQSGFGQPFPSCSSKRLKIMISDKGVHSADVLYHQHS